MRTLNAMPVLGFETRDCHFADYAANAKENTAHYQAVNLIKASGCIPGVGIFIGLFLIVLGKNILKGDQSSGKIEYPKLKGAALITRGLITILGGGVLFTLADIATTIGRAAKAALSKDNQSTQRLARIPSDL